jgi:RND family efflux transporter MFP subunit
MAHPPSLLNSTPTEEVQTPPDTAETPALPLKKPPQKLPWILFGTSLIIAIAGGWLWLRPTHEPNPIEAPVTPLSVSTKVVTPQTLFGIQTLTGTVEAVETVTMTSRVTGQITSLPVQEGDRVKAGQVLVKIDVNDLQAQGHQATAAIAQAQAGVTMAQAAQNQASTGQNQAIALMNQAAARKEQAIAQAQEAQAELAKARLDQQRMAMLRSEGVVSQAQLDEANTQVSVIQTRIHQSQAGIDQASRAIEAAKAAIAQSQASVEQAKAGVQQALSQVKQAQAGEEQAIANLDYGLITAPFAGVVTHKHTEVGAMAGTGQQLITLEGTDPLRFSVDIPESLMAQVKQGDAVKVQIDSLNKSISGQVSQIIPSANPSSRSFMIKVALPRVNDLMPGMFGRLELPLSNRRGIVIPVSTLIRRGQLEGIYVVNPQNQATLRWVKTGKVQGDRVEITSGLVKGDRLITDHLTQLRDGQPVKLREWR